MKIIADENIPQICDYFNSSCDLILKSGRLISRNDLLDADVLLVRSVTRVNEALLQGTSIKLVGSTTAGIDHLDTKWLDQNNIQWCFAAGCNAVAVAEYVVFVIAALQAQGILMQTKPRAGVVGVGQVGRRVVENLKLLGFDVVQCDPLRAETEKQFAHTVLDSLYDLDLIALHTPLTSQRYYPTYHLIEKNFLERQKPGCVLLNAGRGEVVNFNDLKQYGNHLHWCFDVWEHEPNIDLEILNNALIATPHIAGYTVEAKLRGMRMIYDAMNLLPDFKNSLTPIQNLNILQNSNRSQLEKIAYESINWRSQVLKKYDPCLTTKHMKKMLINHLETFDQLRKNFPERHEFASM